MEVVIIVALAFAYFLISDYIEVLKIRAQKDDAPWECGECLGCSSCCTCEEEETEPTESRLPGLDNNANV